MATKTTAKKPATKKVSAAKSAPKPQKSGSVYYPLLIKLLKDDDKLKRGATKSAIVNKMKQQMPEQAAGQQFATAVKRAFIRGVREKDILVLSKDKQVLNFSDDPEKMSFLGSQKYKLTPESKIKYNKLEKEAAKKAQALAEGKPYPPKKKAAAAAPKVVKKAGKKTAAKKVSKSKVAKKTVSRANTSVLKKAKKQQARGKVAAKKKSKKAAK